MSTNEPYCKVLPTFLHNLKEPCQNVSQSSEKVPC